MDSIACFVWDWKRSATRRAGTSTSAAETGSCFVWHWHLFLLQSVTGSFRLRQRKGRFVMRRKHCADACDGDCKSFYDRVSKDGSVPCNWWTFIHIAALR